MINRKYEVALADLNTGDDQVFDTIVTRVRSNVQQTLSETDFLYPKQVLIHNDTNREVEFTVFESEDEYQKYVADANYTSFIRIPINGTFSTNSFTLPRAAKIVVRGIGTETADRDLRIDAINFVLHP